MLLFIELKNLLPNNPNFYHVDYSVLRLCGRWHGHKFFFQSILKLLTYYTPFYTTNRRKVINAETGPVFWTTLYLTALTCTTSRLADVRLRAKKIAVLRVLQFFVQFCTFVVFLR